MGRVYLAWDERVQRDVALKVIDLGTSDIEETQARERFRREASSAGQLPSPNIVQIYDFGDDGEVQFIAMEYVDGDDLKRVIKEQRPLTLLRKLDIIAQICDALNFAHKAKIVHRDVKPANIMVARDGGVAKLVDFGVARIGTNPLKSMAFLTPAYSSPEQTRGEENLDRRSDIFSLGIVLYELVAYRHPFLDPANSRTVEERIRTLRPEPLLNVVRDCPPKMDEIVGQALAKAPADRYQTAELMAFALRDLKRDTIEKLLREAKQHLGKGVLGRAAACYREVLESAPNQTEARIELQKIEDQVSTVRRSEPSGEGLRRGNEALDAERYEEAISEFSRVLRDDPRHEEARRGREKAEKGRRLARYMERARSFCGSGEFKSAKKELQDALNIERDHQPALKLLHEVEAGLHEQEQRRQVQQIMESARRLIAERSYSRALETLLRAQELDAANPEVEALIRSAKEGREREERQRRIRKLCGQIQDTLYREQFEEAERLAGEARKEFPEDPQVLRLYDQASHRAELQRRRRFVEEQQEVVRDLLQKGQFDDAIARLKRALEVATDEPILTGLLKAAEESRARALVEKMIREAHGAASDLMRRKDYSAAIETLEAALAAVGRSPELNALLEVAREAAAEQRQREGERIQQALDRAEAYAADDEYADAVGVLEHALREKRSDEIEKLLVTIRNRWHSFERDRDDALAQARGLLQADNAEAAWAILNKAPKAYAKFNEFQQLVTECRGRVGRVTSIRSLVTQVEQHIKSGALDQAKALLDGALGIYAGEAALESLRQRVAEALAGARQGQLQQLLERASTAVNRMEYAEAISLLSNPLWDSEDISGLKAQAGSLLGKARRLQEDLSRYCIDIEDLLSNGNFGQASNLAKDALSAFHDHPQLRRLEANANRLADAQGKRHYIDEQLETARNMAQQGRLDDAEAVLKRALKDQPEEPDLIASLRTLKDSQARKLTESLVKKAVAGAEERARNKDFAEAISILENGQGSLGPFPELSALLGLMRAEQAGQQRRQKSIERILTRAEGYRRNKDFQRAVEELERDREDLESPEIEDLLTSVRHEWDDFEQDRQATIARAGALLDEGKAEEALRELDAAPESYRRSEEFRLLHEDCLVQIERDRLKPDLFIDTLPVPRGNRPEVESPVEVALEEPPARPEPEDHQQEPPKQMPAPPRAVWWAVTSTLVVLGLAVVFFVLRRPPPPRPSQIGYVELNPMPWAHVLSVQTADGKPVKVPGVPGDTPMVLSLEPGDYPIQLKGPLGTETRRVTVKPGATARLVGPLSGFDIDKAVDDLLKEQ